MVEQLGNDRLRSFREQLVTLIVKLLAQKGDSAVHEVERRAASGEGFVIKGITVESDVLRESLVRFKQQGKGPVVIDEVSGTSAVPAGATSSGPSATAPAGVRWTPTASTASLASKALIECETAEPFCENIAVIGGNKVAVLPKPNVICRPTGEYLQTGDTAEVIARSVSPRDGRVYLRLKKFCGWVCTRSRKDFSKVVLASPGSKVPLEPPVCGASFGSHAVQLLPAVPADSIGAGAAAVREVRFRALTGRCQILSAPTFEAGTSTSGTSLQVREVFAADGVFVQPADGRAYLRLRDGRGWVSERSRADFTRPAVEPLVAGGLKWGPPGVSDDVVEVVDGRPGAGEATVQRRRAIGGKKVIVVERQEEPPTDASTTKRPREESSSSAGSVAVVYRSDVELWPEELGAPRPLVTAARMKLRRLHGFFGKTVHESEQDLKQVTEHAETFKRACPTQKELHQHADHLRKEVAKAKKEWVKAAKDALAAEGVDVATPIGALGQGLSRMDPDGTRPVPVEGLHPAQVNGDRWYCAVLRTPFGTGSHASSASSPQKENDTMSPCKERSGRGDPPPRHLGPLRQSAQEAAEDLSRMRKVLGLDGGGEGGLPAKQRRHCPAGDTAAAKATCATAGA